jgi:predicted AlkP superfamily pyrophosphatase or phosphodiesterase
MVLSKASNPHSYSSKRLPWDSPLSRRDLLNYGATLGFGAVGASLLAGCGSGTPLESSASVTEKLVPAEAKYLAVILVDAGRADYLHYGSQPNIRSLMARGTYFPHAFSGIMEATTPACHAALGTGSFPKNNGGVLGFWWEDGNGKSFTCADLTDPSSATEATAANSLEGLIGSAGVPTMAGLLKRVDPNAKVYSGAGVKFYAADAVGGPDADYITYFWNDGPVVYRPVQIPGHKQLSNEIMDNASLVSRDWYRMTVDQPGLQDRLVVELAMEVVKRERPRVVVLNLGEMDWPVAHLYGGPADPEAVTHLMENADTAIGRLMDTYRHLGIFDQTVFCFMGDHGVLPLEKKVDPEDFNKAVASAGTSMACSDYHTSGSIWLSDPSKSERVAAKIEAFKQPGISAVYYLASRGSTRRYQPATATGSNIRPQIDNANRYLLETMNGANAPHVVVLYEERTGTLGSGGPGADWKGDHGGTSWASQAIPLVMAGPGIRRAHHSKFPARLVDLAPTFLRLMGAPHTGMDGVVLADALVKPLDKEARAQKTASRHLVPVAAALRRQSRSDVEHMHGTLPGDVWLGHKKTVPLNPTY